MCLCACEARQSRSVLVIVENRAAVQAPELQMFHAERRRGVGGTMHVSVTSVCLGLG